MDNVIVPNPDALEKKMLEFRKEGKESIHILADFNKTFTKSVINGVKAPSLISHLRNPEKRYLTEDYAKKAQALYDKYHPIEISTEIASQEKNKKMLEWWSTHYELLIKSGLNEKVIEKLVNDMLRESLIELREGASTLFNLISEEDIPVIILSAAGIGNMITLFLKKNNLLFPNMYFIGNTLEFDKNGKFIGIRDNKIIHVLNKNEKEIESLKIYREIENRKNIILLGDSLDDLKMLENVDFKRVIKIAFYNTGEENLDDFKKNFDMIILNDGSMAPVKGLLEAILK